MLFTLQQYQEVVLILLIMTTKTYIHLNVWTRQIGIGIFYLLGEPISLHRLRCSPFAVVHYSFMSYCLVATAILARK